MTLVNMLSVLIYDDIMAQGLCRAICDDILAQGLCRAICDDIVPRGLCRVVVMILCTGSLPCACVYCMRVWRNKGGIFLGLPT